MNRLLIRLISIPSLLLLINCNQESNEEKDTRSPQAGHLVITNTWARPTVEGANSAAYMTIHNHTNRADTLVGITGDVAAQAEFHESYEKEGMVGMRPADTLIISPGNRLELKPGGLHVMLMQVTRPLISGDSLQLQLQFTVAGTKDIMVDIQ